MKYIVLSLALILPACGGKKLPAAESSQQAGEQSQAAQTVSAAPTQKNWQFFGSKEQFPACEAKVAGTLFYDSTAEQLYTCQWETDSFEYVEVHFSDLEGDKGESGDKGATGEVGDKGDKGATGPQGPQGPQGDKGSDG